MSARALRDAAIALLAALALATCDEGEIGTPLSVELIGPGAGVVGEELSVLYDVSGRSLLGVVFEWGDGAVDSLATAGAQTAAGSMQHTYAAEGVFTVRAVVRDAVDGVASAAVTINIQQGQGGPALGRPSSWSGRDRRLGYNYRAAASTPPRKQMIGTAREGPGASGPDGTARKTGDEHTWQTDC